MKFLETTARVVFIMSLPALLISGSLALAFNSPALYENGFNKYRISEVTGIAPPELVKAAQGLISYWNSTEDRINVTIVKDGKPFALFNEREIGHLKDVKDLIIFDYRVFLATFTYALAYAAMVVLTKRSLRRLAAAALSGTVLLGALVVAGIIGSFFDFDQLFLRFHLLVFNNNLWQLDPARDYLIMMFPEGFWSDAAIFCMGLAAAGAVLIGGSSFICLRRLKEPG